MNTTFRFYVHVVSFIRVFCMTTKRADVGGGVWLNKGNEVVRLYISDEIYGVLCRFRPD